MNKAFFEVLEIIEQTYGRMYELYGYTEQQLLQLMDDDIAYAKEMMAQAVRQKILVQGEHGVIQEMEFYINLTKGEQVFEVGMKGDLVKCK